MLFAQNVDQIPGGKMSLGLLFVFWQFAANILIAQIR